MSVGEMSIGEMSVGEMSGYRNVTGGGGLQLQGEIRQFRKKWLKPGKHHGILQKHVREISGSFQPVSLYKKNIRNNDNIVPSDLVPYASLSEHTLC